MTSGCMKNSTLRNATLGRQTRLLWEWPILRTCCLYTILPNELRRVRFCEPEWVRKVEHIPALVCRIRFYTLRRKRYFFRNALFIQLLVLRQNIVYFLKLQIYLVFKERQCRKTSSDYWNISSKEIYLFNAFEIFCNILKLYIIIICYYTYCSDEFFVLKTFFYAFVFIQILKNSILHT